MNDTDRLIAAVETFLRRYVVFRSPAQRIATALWILHSWAIEAADATPYLIVTSAEKRSGKSRLLEVLELLVRSPLRASSVSVAALFRLLSEGPMTLLLDEVDAIFGAKAGPNEDLRSCVNAGHRRGTKVARCVGDGSKMKVERFETFGPKALAGIGRLPDTVADRGIPIELDRRRNDEKVERFRYRHAEVDARDLVEWLNDWSERAVPTLRETYPQVPESLDDRAADGWEPLLAIAELGGSEWQSKTLLAAIELSAKEAQDDTVGILLLSHVREAFEEHGEKLPTDDLIRSLCDREDGPWASWWARSVRDGETRGPASKLARLLKPFGVKPQKMRMGEGTARGYLRSDFDPVFDRYLPPSLEKTEHGTNEPEKRASDQGCSDVPFVPSISEGTTTAQSNSRSVVPSVPTYQ